MGKLLMTLLSSAAIGVGVIASTTPAAAFWTLLIPVLIGVGGRRRRDRRSRHDGQPTPDGGDDSGARGLFGACLCRSWACLGPWLRFLPSLGERRVEDGPNLRLSGGA